MKIPTLGVANEFLEEAQKLNPGPWVEHSINVAKAAKMIAILDKDIDPDAAYIFGLLHDIGRRAGVYYVRHALDGYNFLMKKGYDDAARICMTHAHSSKGEWDCTEEEMEFVKYFLDGIEFDEYDMLIQLCDALSLPHGYCLIEKRIVEGVLRLNVMNEFILVMWRGVFDAKKFFESKLGCSIYTILPGVLENTFGMSNKELIRRLSK